MTSQASPHQGNVRFGSVSAMPGFLAESGLWSNFFGSKERTRLSIGRASAAAYLAGHRFGLTQGATYATPPAGATRVALSVALYLLERGPWTLPSLEIEQAIAEACEKTLGWRVIPPANRSIGDLRLVVDQRTLAATDVRHVLAPTPVGTEANLQRIVAQLCEAADPNSGLEQRFIMEIAAEVMPLPLLALLEPQRELESMGLRSVEFSLQRVDFALETWRGNKLVIEIDGGQHASGTEANLDGIRDAALVRCGWKVLRIPSAKFADLTALRSEFIGWLSESGVKLDQWEGERNRTLAEIFWAATAVVRLQCLVLEAALAGMIPLQARVAVRAPQMSGPLCDLALSDLTRRFGNLLEMYGVSDAAEFMRADEGSAELIADVDVWDPWSEVTRSDSASIAWSRPARRTVGSSARQIKPDQQSHRFLPSDPPIEILDQLVKDLFRKEGLRRDADGHSDQYEIARRILRGMDVVGLLPTGAGKSLPYMLAGLVLPGLTLYVGPLVSLLQDQTERLEELGIAHAAYLSSALERGEKARVLDQVHAGLKFILVSPERFLSKDFIREIKNKSLAGDVSQLVIDECHCVSEWGHDFRPAYLNLGRIARNRRAALGFEAPVVALTGTASTIVLSDVLRELGVEDPAACIRAARLDRPEIELQCQSPTSEEARAAAVENAVRDLLMTTQDPAEGVLIFCTTRSGPVTSVFSVAGHLTGALGGTAVRFYVGGKEPWASYAKYSRDRAVRDSPNPESIAPLWARDSYGNVLSWNEVKARVQRDFISTTSHSFRVLVATKAFGMGIDKPSIRRIVHVMPPTSPESYYQEVGRAGRDGRPSTALLLFRDPHPQDADAILNPAVEFKEAASIYEQVDKQKKFKAGDFVRTFFFHHQNFSQASSGATDMQRVIGELARLVDLGENTNVSFDLLGGHTHEFGEDSPRIEYAIVRLFHLGIVAGYFKDWRGKEFLITPSEDWLRVRSSPKALAEYVATRYGEFVSRYRLLPPTEAVQKLRDCSGEPAELYSLATRMLMKFVYAQIERRRRTATRQMLELCRIGRESIPEMRKRLLNYLQVSARYTEALERLRADTEPSEWQALMDLAEAPQDLAELHGACQRVLESYPTHPGLLLISGVTRPVKTAVDAKRSLEELEACLNAIASNPARVAAAIELLRSLQDQPRITASPLRDVLDDVIGLFHVGQGDLQTGAAFVSRDRVRRQWIARLIDSVTRGLPTSS
jgi:ATP-dependent DNA helicase RecQ